MKLKERGKDETRRHADRRVAAWLATALVVTACVDSGACAGESSGYDLSGGPTAGAGGSAGSAGAEAEALFRALEDDLVDQCALCHAVGGSADTPFLGDPETLDPDPYEAITSWPGALASNPESSVLVSWPNSGMHGGSTPTPELASAMRGWLTAEAAAVAPVSQDGGPTIPPFKPILGFNAVYLDALGEGFAGMAVTFTAAQLGAGVLVLADIEVHPTSQLGIRLEHPLFTVFAPGGTLGDPDPTDSFSNVVDVFQAGQAGQLGPGVLILTNWMAGGKLQLAFAVAQVLDPAGSGTGGSSPGGCSAVAAFLDHAQAALQSNCFGCHGGANGQAMGAVDMSQLSSAPGVACGQVRNRVDLQSPAVSQIFITTDPSGSASHPYKFGGSNANFDTFRNSVTQWIVVETP